MTGDDIGFNTDHIEPIEKMALEQIQQEGGQRLIAAAAVHDTLLHHVLALVPPAWSVARMIRHIINLYPQMDEGARDDMGKLYRECLRLAALANDNVLAKAREGGKDAH